MFSDSDAELIDEKELEGSVDGEFKLVDEGVGEGSGLGWVITLCVLAVFLVVVLCYLKNRIFKC